MIRRYYDISDDKIYGMNIKNMTIEGNISKHNLELCIECFGKIKILTKLEIK